jgi:hypothetical protein
MHTTGSFHRLPERIYIVSDFPRTPKGAANCRALTERFAAAGSEA